MRPLAGCVLAGMVFIATGCGRGPAALQTPAATKPVASAVNPTQAPLSPPAPFSTPAPPTNTPMPTATPIPPSPTPVPPSPTPTIPPSTDFIIDDEAPNCPTGGPVVRVTGGKATVLAQGEPLQKPRGSAWDADGTLLIADGLAGLLRLDLKTGKVVVVASGPPWMPRDVAVAKDGTYLVVDWPERPIRGATQPVGLLRVAKTGQVTPVLQGAPLQGPHGLSLDADGNAIIADNLAGVVRVGLDGKATVVAAPATRLDTAAGKPDPAGKPQPGVKPDSGAKPAGGPQIVVPVDVRVDVDGSYVVADLIGAGLFRVTAAGQVSVIHRGPPFSVGDPATKRGGPRGIVIDRNGDYLVADELAKALFRVTRQGQVTTVFSGAPLCGPADLIIVPAG